LSAQLLERYKQKIKSLELVPSGGGCFEVQVDGDLLYSKLQTGSFPDESSIIAQVGQRLKL
jgi:selenoprotein W-related protein